MSRFFQSLLCLFGKHYYLPHYVMSFTQANKHAPMRKRRYRYTCEHCHQKTSWMTQQTLDAFHIKHCPTWGPRGSDSQGYRQKD